MRKFIIPFFLILVFIYPLKPFELKEVLTIGSEKPHYEFFLITNVEVDEGGNIYIVDGKACALKKYSPQGKYIVGVGKCEQGPEDFGRRSSIVPKIRGSLLYVYDFVNKRINLFDKNLKHLKILKFKGKSFYRFFFIVDSLFYGPIFIAENGSDRIYVYDMNMNKKFSFFREYPDYVNTRKKEAFYKGVSSFYSSLLMDYNNERGIFAITFFYPSKKTIVYFYDKNGKFVNKQFFVIMNHYRFPRFLLSYPPKYPKSYENIRITSLNFYKNKYLVLAYKIEKFSGKKYLGEKAYILLINIDKAKIIEKKEISPGFRILNIKGNYLYAKNFDDDIEKLHVYKIEGIE